MIRSLGKRVELVQADVERADDVAFRGFFRPDKNADPTRCEIPATETNRLGRRFATTDEVPTTWSSYCGSIPTGLFALMI